MKTTSLAATLFSLMLALVVAAAPYGCALEQARPLASATEFDAAALSDTPRAAGDTEPEPEQRALVSFAGDCCLSSMQGSSAFNAVYDSNGPEYFLSGVQEIFAHDDLTVVNLEAPLTTSTNQAGKGEAYDEEGNPLAFWFKAPPEYAQILTRGSVEMCNLANNHILDYGSEGMEETQRVLGGVGIDSFIWETTMVKEVKGIRIGFFGFSFDSNAANIQAVMDQLRAEGAEVIVAYFHDGIEREYYPSASQEAAAYAAIDYGASAVIMSHPHVIQGTEEYKGAFIAWSLGNFCYGGHTNPADKDSMIVQLEFVRTAAGITCTPQVIPCSISSTPGTNDYRPLVLTGAEGQRVLDKIAEIST